MDRDQDVRRFAEVMRWSVARESDDPHDIQFEWQRSASELAMSDDDDEVDVLGFPAPDAPASAHLAFVGKLSEMLALPVAVDARRMADLDRLCAVTFLKAEGWCYAPDVAHAAIRAAITAKNPSTTRF
jgi:hypothetical protein